MDYSNPFFIAEIFTKGVPDKNLHNGQDIENCVHTILESLYPNIDHEQKIWPIENIPDTRDMGSYKKRT